jgi:hypothetical protein
VQTSQPQVITVTTETATQGFQEIVRFSSSTEVIAALTFLSSLNQSLSMSQVQSVQKMSNGSSILYKISVKLLSVGQLELKEKTIFYQYMLSFSPATSTFSIVNATYVNLDSPTFDQQLTFDDIKAGRVLAVFRDIPYYKLIFEASGSNEITFIILFNLNGNTVSILSLTTQQRKLSDSIITTSASSTASTSTIPSSTTTTTGVSSTASPSATITSTSSQTVSNQNVAVS